MKSGGLNDDEIVKLKSLPNGHAKGMAVAIVEIGETYEATLEQRSDPDFQRSVAAFGSDSGKMVTEIKRVQYLKLPVAMSGQGGVFRAQINRDVIPDGWIDRATKDPYQVDKIRGLDGFNDTDGTSRKRSKPVYSISG
jgi:hypothetical protein